MIVSILNVYRVPTNTNVGPCFLDSFQLPGQTDKQMNVVWSLRNFFHSSQNEHGLFFVAHFKYYELCEH